MARTNAITIAEQRLNAHNKAVLPSLMAEAFDQLSPAQQGAVYRIAELFLNAAAWRRGALGHDPSIVLDLDALARVAIQVGRDPKR